MEPLMGCRECGEKNYHRYACGFDIPGRMRTPVLDDERAERGVPERCKWSASTLPMLQCELSEGHEGSHYNALVPKDAIAESPSPPVTSPLLEQLIAEVDVDGEAAGAGQGDTAPTTDDRDSPPKVCPTCNHRGFMLGGICRYRFDDEGHQCRCKCPAPAEAQVISAYEVARLRHPESGTCACGLKEVPAGIDGITWYWQRHSREGCTLELPNSKCWCGLLRSEHVDGHATAPPDAPRPQPCDCHGSLSCKASRAPDGSRPVEGETAGKGFTHRCNGVDGAQRHGTQNKCTRCGEYRSGYYELVAPAPVAGDVPERIWMAPEAAHHYTERDEWHSVEYGRTVPATVADNDAPTVKESTDANE